MQYRKLGRTGLKVSELCLGTMTFGWSVEEAESHAIMSTALERGINFFDTADVYSRWDPRSYAGKTEEIMGRWFAADPSRRERVGKLGHYLTLLSIFHDRKRQSSGPVRARTRS